MEIESLHLFHGFLGSPEDWLEVENYISSRHSIKIFKHNLISDFQGLGADVTFQKWAQFKKQELSLIPGGKGIVGYSLGGRLAMHLPLESSDRILLIGSHPGLWQNIEERLKNDQDWIERSKKLSQSQWIRQWNQQEIFQEDLKRPHRELEGSVFRLWIETLKPWSLAIQKPREKWFAKYKRQIHWCYGDRDKKFEKLRKSRIKELIPPEQISCIENSGHGVIFENPNALAQLIEKVF